MKDVARVWVWNRIFRFAYICPQDGTDVAGIFFVYMTRLHVPQQGQSRQTWSVKLFNTDILSVQFMNNEEI